MLVLLVLLSNTKCMGQVSKAENFSYLDDAEYIRYKQVPFSENVFRVKKCLDLRNLEFDETTVNAGFHSEADSLFLGIFDNELRWYVVINRKLSCYKQENPLLKIKYKVPKLAVVKQNDWENRVSQEYEAEGLYCGKDSMKIADV